MARIRITEYEGRRELEAKDEVGIPLSHLKAAATTDRLYSLMGLILGFVIVLVGAYLIYRGIQGTKDLISFPVPWSDQPVQIETTWPGVGIALFGVVFAWITRPTVTY